MTFYETLSSLSLFIILLLNFHLCKTWHLCNTCSRFYWSQGATERWGQAPTNRRMTWPGHTRADQDSGGDVMWQTSANIQGPKIRVPVRCTQTKEDERGWRWCLRWAQEFRMALWFLVPSLAILGGRAGHNIRLNLFHRKPQEPYGTIFQHVSALLNTRTVVRKL